MHSVFKYTIKVDDVFSIELPIGAQILSVQTQYTKPQLWALVDSREEAPTELRYFRLAGTGHPIKEDKEHLNFIGTFQLLDGAFIGHLFELIELKE